jgi:putative transposase
MDGTAHGCADAALALYEQLVSPSSLDVLRKELGLPGGGGLFSSALTVWIWVRQRLAGGVGVESAWLECSEEEALRLSPKSSRAKRGVLSPHASGYDYARHKLPLDLVAAAADRLFVEAEALLGAPCDGWMLIDGTSLTLPHSPAIAKAFPPAENQFGPSHWPVVKVVLAHDLAHGLSMRPEWGPMYGPNAVSEPALALRLIERLPEKCGVIADRGFGILQIARALEGRRMLVRLTEPRAKPMLPAGASLSQDVDAPCVWRAGAFERRKHPDLPEDFGVPGRLIVRHVIGPGQKPVTVCLFTNDLTKSAEELVELYAQRWNIETDFRSLKATVGLEILRSKSPDMVSKELVLSIAAYNLVRTIMALAAQQAGLEPRKLSFTRARNCIEIYARRGPMTEELLGKMLRAIGARPHPNRKHPRSFPRESWHRRETYPPRQVEGRA